MMQDDGGKPVATAGNGPPEQMKSDGNNTELRGSRSDRVTGDAFKNIEFSPTFAYFKNITKGKTNFSWEGITLKIGEKDILKGISGHVNGGETCALMGPSGAGKTSLLNVLAGRIIESKKKKLGGTIRVNGKPVNTARYRKHIAYVLQNDDLYATATARESLEFSARLRLPRSTTSEQVKEIVDDLLNSLGLTHVQDTMVGSELIRGLSGGEKKRVAIGVELVTNPSLLFLDEPTSGLDSFSAWKVVKILECLAKATGCSILCTIHQPSSEIFNSFHSTMILTRGNVLYNGAVDDLPKVLESLGFPVPPLTNPADYVMLIAQTAENPPCYNPDNKEGAMDAYQKKSSAETDHVDIEKPAGVYLQAWALAGREFRNLYRDVGFLAATFGITIFLNILFGVVFLNAADRDDPDYSVSTNFGALLVVLMSAMFGSAQGPLLTFPLERGVMIREYQTGTYSAFPYLLSKLLVEIPMYFVRSLAAVIATYWLISYNGNFIYFVFVVWLISLCSASYAFVLGAAVHDAKQGQEFAPLVLVPQMLFAGLFVPLSAIPTWLRWVQWICVIKYGVNIGALIEFGGDCSGHSDVEGYHQNCTRLLDQNDVDEDLLWAYILIMIAIFLVFRTLSLVILVFRARYFTN